MTWHATQQPLPYVILNRTFQAGTACDFCGTSLDLHRGLLGNEDGFYCDDACWMRATVQAKREATMRGFWYTAAFLVVVLALYVLLEVW